MKKKIDKPHCEKRKLPAQEVRELSVREHRIADTSDCETEQREHGLIVALYLNETTLKQA